MNKVVYLDADFVIKTSKIQVDSSTLFDKVLELPYSFRITNTVLSEIKFDLNKKFATLVLNGKLSVVRLADCFEELTKTFDEKTIENIALSTIKEISSEICGDDTLYNTYFKKLEANQILGDSLKHFSEELENAIRRVPKDNNIGEITTLLSMSLTNRLENITVISLLSHDSQARSCVLNLPENINSFDCYSCFHLLKINEILTYTEAKKYVNRWKTVFPHNNTVKIIENNRSQGVDFLDFVIYLYKNSNYSILRNGLLKKVS